MLIKLQTEHGIMVAEDLARGPCDDGEVPFLRIAEQRKVRSYYVTDGRRWVPHWEEYLRIYVDQVRVGGFDVIFEDGTQLRIEDTEDAD